MVLKDVIADATKQLKLANIEAPALEAGVILCSVLCCDRIFLYSHDDYEVKPDEYSKYTDLIRDRINGRPLQYITGHQEFMSLDFMVTPSVLIPRQDTEVLVESVINCLGKSGTEDKVILDIGTGSGCIAVSLAYYIKESRMFAMDISPSALKVARVNARSAGVEDRISFITGDIFEGLRGVDWTNPIESKLSKPQTLYFDGIVSNPPYIQSSHVVTLERQVRDYEPYAALNGGADGLDFYRCIVNEAVQYLKPGALLAFEVGIGQADDVVRLMEDAFNNIRIIKDLAQIDRVVLANRSKY